MTNFDPQIMILVIGVAVVLTVVIAVECVSLLRIMRRCAANTRKEEEERKKDKRENKKKTAIESWRDAKAAGTEGDKLVVAMWNACDEFKEIVYEQVANLRKKRREPLRGKTLALAKFSWRLLTATGATAVIYIREVLSLGGLALFVVLVFIQILYYDRFDFNVFEYLSSYSVPAILLSLLQVVILLVLLSFIAAAVSVFLFPLAILQLIRIVDEMRLVAVKALAGFLFAACRRWLWCSRRVSSLLDDATDPGSTEDHETRRLVSPLLSYIEDYGSKLIEKESESESSQRSANIGGVDPMPSADVPVPPGGENPPTPVAVAPEEDKNDSKKKSLSFAGWLFVIAFFVVGSLIALCVEPRYRAHAACDGSIITRVVLDPPLQGQASFTRIGSIGGHVFIVPESSCGRSEEKGGTGESEDHQSLQTAGEEAESNGAASMAVAADQRSIKNNAGNAGISGTDGDEGDGDGGELTWKAVLLRYVPDPIQERLPFLYSAHLTKSRDRTTDVTVVPLSRVLCMYEVRDDRSSESAVCSPVLPPGGDGPRILVHKTQENTWKIVIPSDVRIRIEDERLLTEEIEQDVCDGGAAEISEPVLFTRGETTPLDTRAVTAFLNRSALQEGMKLHVLGFASGDGNRQYNDDLARQRAEAVTEIVKELAPDRELVIDSWGETHLTNGVANSRSVRIVGCRPEAGDSGI